jgi:hypothetical protein
MAVLAVPPISEEIDWPSLGPGICDFVEGHGQFAGRGLVFGPGDLRGERAELDADKTALIHRSYQVFPLPEKPAERKTVLRRFDAGVRWQATDHPAGRRRFKQVTIELPKGLAKTEFGAWITAGELHPEGPVRCIGWTLEGGAYVPVGGPIRDPYIPLVSYTEEQTEELGYGALYAILAESGYADDFDIGLERIVRADGTGRAVALAGSPNARDGARTTFQWFDEPHRMFSPLLKKARTTMLANIPKRIASDAFTLDTSTRHDPGEKSVHQDSYETAKLIDAGKASDPTFFFFSRHAKRSWKVLPEGDTAEEREADLERANDELESALREAAGSGSSWRDFRSIVAMFRRPGADVAYLCRTYLNWTMRGAGRAFDVDDIQQRLCPPLVTPPSLDKGAAIALGFDGSRRRDATGVAAVRLDSGYMWNAGVWERPGDADEDWEVPRDEVDQKVVDLFDFYTVLWMNGDPEWWDDTLGAWAGRYNHGRHGKVVHEHYTHQPKKMGLEVRAFTQAIESGEAKFGPDPALSGEAATENLATLIRHFGNAHKNPTQFNTEQGDKLYTISKERRDSPLVIDLAMCAVLAWDALVRALARGPHDDGAPAPLYRF